ncbi:MAG: hypothetical protein PWP25_662 [Sphaerochaeta sp.]|jgi:predicted dehydrogenase|nr:hypothetical protein [Sphaerochaeta sp.]
MKKIQVGIIGLGFIGLLQLDALRRIPEVEVVAASSTSEAKRKMLREVYSIAKVYENWEDLVIDQDVQVVHNCTSTALHYETNSFIIQHDKHLYAEKPLTLTADEGRKLCSLLALHPIAVAVNHQYRSNAAIHAMKELLQSKQSGTLLFIRAYYLQDPSCREADYTKRRNPEDSPARALSDIGSHVLDLIQFLCGSSIVDVCAMMETHYPTRIDPQNGNRIAIASDDTTFVQFSMQNKVKGQFVVSKAAHGHKNDLEISLSCSELELSWRQEEPDRFQIRNRESGCSTIFMNSSNASDGVKPYISLPAGHVMGYADALRNHMQQFYTSLRQESYAEAGQPYTTLEESAYIGEIIESCIKSSRNGRWEQVGER